MVLKKIHHLIRYFVFLAIGAFAGYVREINNEIFLIFVGPCVYLAQKLKSVFSSLLGTIHLSHSMSLYVFLLPVMLIYYALIGFMLKQLWNERGKIRYISVTVFSGFLVYIHYLAWKNLMAYLA